MTTTLFKHFILLSSLSHWGYKTKWATENSALSSDTDDLMAQSRIAATGGPGVSSAPAEAYKITTKPKLKWIMFATLASFEVGASAAAIALSLQELGLCINWGDNYFNLHTN